MAKSKNYNGNEIGAQSGTRGGSKSRAKSDNRNPNSTRSGRDGKITGNVKGQQRSVNGAPFREDSKGTRQQRRAEEAIDTFAVLSKGNPLEYYTKFSKFANDAANLPFALPLGTPFIIEPATQQKYAVPGVMRIVFSPAIGVSRDFTSAINRSSTRFYTYLRSNQKASAAYDHQDITMMELSLDSAYMFHAMCARIYGVMQNVTPLNEYYARTLIASMGGIYSDLRSNLSDFRNWINTYAYNLGQFAMPQGITMFDRHRWMCDGLYVDSDTTRAQTYLFMPLGFWKYDNSVETGSQLTFKQYLSVSGTGAAQYTTAQLMEFGNDLLNAIAGEEDFQYISGDIYNFYGGTQYQLPYIDENYQVLPAFNKTVLSQIENLTIMGPFMEGTNVITQNPSVNDGALIYNPKFAFESTTEALEKMFMNFHWDTPTPGDVIEASRLMAIPQATSTGGVMELLQCGTEIVHRIDVFAINPSTLNPRSNPIESSVMIEHTDGSSEKSILTDILHLAQFDWAPCVKVYLTSGNESTPNHSRTFVGFTWDIDNFNEVYKNYLATIHDACLYSLFEVGTNRVTVS